LKKLYNLVFISLMSMSHTLKSTVELEDNLPNYHFHSSRHEIENSSNG